MATMWGLLVAAARAPRRRRRVSALAISQSFTLATPTPTALSLAVAVTISISVVVVAVSVAERAGALTSLVVGQTSLTTAMMVVVIRSAAAVSWLLVTAAIRLVPIRTVAPIAGSDLTLVLVVRCAICVRGSSSGHLFVMTLLRLVLVCGRDVELGETAVRGENNRGQYAENTHRLVPAPQSILSPQHSLSRLAGLYAPEVVVVHRLRC